MANYYELQFKEQLLASSQRKNKLESAIRGGLLIACVWIMNACSAQSVSTSNSAYKTAYVARYKNDKVCAISYTFDDGLKEHYTLVTPAMNKLGLKGTFVINGSKINKDDQSITDTTRMTWVELKEMARDGHEISNHGWAHKNFNKFSLDEIREDIQKNDSAIFANIGILPRTFAYPNNSKTPQGVKLASENRVDTRTFQRSIGSKSTIENLESWINDLLRDQDWGVGMTHGITYGYDHFALPGIFWQHLQQVKNMEDKIWVGTFKEVAAYIKEREAVQLEIVQHKNRLVITPHLKLDKVLYTEPLTLVVIRNSRQQVKVVQDKRKLAVTMLPDKALFAFNPFGGTIKVLYR